MSSLPGAVLSSPESLERSSEVRRPAGPDRGPSPDPAPRPAVSAAGSWLSRLGAVNELTKPRITRMVVLTAGVGFALSSIGRGGTLGPMLAAGVGCLIGTALSSAGANGLNQVLEVARDARMNRTAHRPVPSGRLGRGAGLVAGLTLGVAGLLVLAVTGGPAAAAVSLATMAIYLGVYTPIKPLTVLNTWVGAVPGALPPLIGWCAAAWAADRGAGWAALAEPGGWSIFALMAVWQIPHFLAIAWMYREDYARGGYRMLPIIDPDGRVTARQVVLWSAILLPASLAPWWAMPGRVSWVYALVALLTGAAYVALAAGLLRDRGRDRARRVFLASVAHLPVLLLALVADAALGAWSRLGG